MNGRRVAWCGALLIAGCAHATGGTARQRRDGSKCRAVQVVRPMRLRTSVAPAPTAPLRAGFNRDTGRARTVYAPHAWSRCARGSAPFLDALARITQLDAELRALTAGDDAGRARDTVIALLRHRCLQWTSHFDAGLDGASISGVQRWWSDGGRRWIESMLDPERSAQHPDASGVWLAPHELPSLSLSTAGASSIASVLCPEGDTQCGRESLAWRARMQPALTRAAEEHLPLYDESSSCAEREAAARSSPLLRWSVCAHEAQRALPMLPIGSFRLPRGWLVIVWNNEEFAALDLDRGVLYSTDANMFRTGRRFTVPWQASRVNRARLREFALSVLLAGFVADSARQSELRWIPRAVERARQSAPAGRIVSAPHPTQHHQSIAHWAWFDGETRRATGALDHQAISSTVMRWLTTELHAIEDERIANTDSGDLPALLETPMAQSGDVQDDVRDMRRARLLLRARATEATEHGSTATACADR